MTAHDVVKDGLSQYVKLISNWAESINEDLKQAINRGRNGKEGI